MSPLALLDPAVAAAHHAVVLLAQAIQPAAGDAAVALALVLLSVLVRVLLLPLAISATRADLRRRTLLPELDRIRRRYGGDRARLAREVAALHRKAGISPLAGLLPTLAQAPVLMTVYRLCVVHVVAGHPNTVLGAHLLGVPLAAQAPTVVAAAGVLSGPSLVALAILAGLLGVAWLTSAQNVRRLRHTAPAAGTPAGLAVSMRVLPFGTVVVALFTPLALSLYLLTSTTWTVAERALLPRLLQGYGVLRA